VEGIHALPAGHSLTWQSGMVRQSRYWDLVDDGAAIDSATARVSPSAAERQHAALTLQPMLEEAVRLQLVSDVPVGIFLSGGIDSSALVSILSRGGVTPATFSIVFQEADFSEAEYSRAIAKKFRTDHHEITVSQEDVRSAIPDALRAMDLPTMDAVNTYFVSRETRAAGIKVALSGLGGDEVFAGYSNFRIVPRMERFASLWKHVPRAARTSLASAFTILSRASDQNQKLASLLRENGRLVHPYFLSRMLFTPSQLSNLFPSGTPEQAARALAEQETLLQRTLPLDPVNRVSYLESRCYMLNTLLRDADFMSMSQGLEVRVPLIDHLLAKTVLALPGSWKLSGSSPKRLLVESLDNSLPREIVRRVKRGFTLPFEHWLRSELRAEVEPVLTAGIGNGPLGGILDTVRVRKVWEDFQRGATSWTRPWSLYVLHRWCELHM
jgi:asparagine synthase (glutamine-hydrolysing)